MTNTGTDPCHGAAQRSVRCRPSPLLTWRLVRVIRYVETHLDRKIRLADLAKEARLSRMHFAAQFNAATGFSPLEYVTHRRVAEAKDLLRRTDESIVQIALSVGFQNQAHFTTVFRRLVHQTPRRWRLSGEVGQRDALGSDYRLPRYPSEVLQSRL